MEVKVIKPQDHVAPHSPISTVQDSRRVRLIQYLTRSIPGSSSRQSLIAQKTSSNAEAGTLKGSSGEESDEELHVPASQNASSSHLTGSSLLQKLSNGLSKRDPSSSISEKASIHSEGMHVRGMSKSVLEVSKVVAADIKGSFGRLLEMKSMLIEKLSSIPTIPADSLEHARHSIESIISEATQSAYGKTKDVMWQIRMKLVEIIPSLSPHETKKIVDDVESKVNGISKATDGDGGGHENLKVSSEENRAASTAIAPQPTSGFAASMDRVKAWALLRSRL
ncbi:hypothetical protein KP509_28G054100 [Ceratopteris richardii]|uniref:Uncharacterized protein n=1 Tax=Ceratopteris richardii TaxID=49495 RepID=A0A8T2RE63_CERRI|nr:hypothetical protein KP509_28G054100 [Ceratopteris richardii]KAH7294048.1 hypothetical protein KP509_28G054100 [Ceratopteris richardii]